MKTVTIWGVKIPVRHEASADYLKWMRANLGSKAVAAIGWKENQARKAAEYVRDYARRHAIELPHNGRMWRAIWGGNRIRAVAFSEDQQLVLSGINVNRYVETVTVPIPHWDWEPAVTGRQYVPDGREIPAEATAEEHRAAYRDYPFQLAA